MSDDIKAAVRVAQAYGDRFQALAVLLQCGELDDAAELLRVLQRGLMEAPAGDWAATTAAMNAALAPLRARARTAELHRALQAMNDKPVAN